MPVSASYFGLTGFAFPVVATESQPPVGPSLDALTHSVAQIVAQLLIDLGLTTAPENDPLLSWPVYSPNEPDQPDNVLTIQDTTGRVDGRNNLTHQIDEHYSFQVRIRASDDTVGSRKAREVAIALDTQVFRRGVVVEDSTYCVHSLSRQGTVIPLGQMPNRRAYLYTVNYLTHLVQTS